MILGATKFFQGKVQIVKNLETSTRVNSTDSTARLLILWRYMAKSIERS